MAAEDSHGRVPVGNDERDRVSEREEGREEGRARTYACVRVCVRAFCENGLTAQSRMCRSRSH